MMSNTSFLDPLALRSVDSAPLRGSSPTLIDQDKVVAHLQQASTLR